MMRRVRAVFNDASKGEKPVPRSDRALYPRGSVVWRVHGDVTTMMIGGMGALLLQMLHPAALAGVWEFSNFRQDMLGRLRRTARFVAVTTYAEREEALRAIDRVKAIHLQVEGVLADGGAYRASDPALLAWVHACEAWCFLQAWRRFGEPGMSAEDQDAYYAQAGEVARRLGADPVPQTRGEVEALLARYRPALQVDDRTRTVATLLIHQPSLGGGMAPIQRMLVQAAIGLLPDWARQMHGLRQPPLASAASTVGVWSMAGALRWAYGGVKL
ncbi:MAG: hypothetical protein JWM33_1137 [Caulobacteraceae bacterium]|nr:hypothetical protein [Caulobacteraceae bacterium]